MCVKWDTCPLGWSFKISNTGLFHKDWALFSLMGVKDKASCLLKLDIQEANLSYAGLKNWGAHCRAQCPCSSSSSGLWVLSWLLDAVPGMDLWQDCVSASPLYFNVGFFSFVQCVGVAHPVFGFLSEEIVLYVATDLVCLWEEIQDPPTSPSWTRTHCIWSSIKLCISK